MKLQRYLRKSDKAMYFGDCFVKHTYDFEWYITENKNRIGIENNPSTEAESFVRGFLVRDDVLLITPSRVHPKIKRKSDSYGRMNEFESGIEEVYSLIELLQSQEKTYAFITSDQEDGTNSNILTFSLSAPPSDLYSMGKIMPIEIEV